MTIKIKINLNNLNTTQLAQLYLMAVRDGNMLAAEEIDNVGVSNCGREDFYAEVQKVKIDTGIVLS